MPTGYTAAIQDGISFEQFVLNCARAFGALIMMRDDPSDTPIPDSFQASDHHLKELDKSKVRLQNLRAMTIEEAEAEAHKSYVKELKQHRRRVKEKAELRIKYETMLDKVKAWEPPSPDHNGLKAFMIEQITGSIDFDCSMKHMEEPKRLTGEEWLGKQTEKALWDIEYHTKEHSDEVERTNGRNIWIRQLRESLAP